MKITSIIVASVAASVADARKLAGAKAEKQIEEVLSMSAPLMEDLSMSVPLFEADISMPMSMPVEPVVEAKARKLRYTFGRRYLSSKVAKRTETDEEEEEEVMSMSVPLEQDLSMSAPLFAAEISMSMPDDEPVIEAKARKLRDNFGRRTQAKATKETEVEEEMSMSVPLVELDMSLPLDVDLSMSAPLFEAAFSMSMPDELVVGAKARKL